MAKRASYPIVPGARNVMRSVTQKPENGKISGLRPHKIKAVQMARTFEKTTLEDKDKIALDLRTCGNKVITANVNGENVILAAMFCKRRLCPMCAWRRSERVFGNIHTIINEPEFAGLKYIFLTLTTRNCTGAELPQTLDQLSSAWQSLVDTKYRPFRKGTLGTFRAIEVTYNPTKDTYHPHIHVLAAVGKDYFKKDNPLYIGHDRLMELWRGALGVDYDPWVYIEAIKKNKKKQAGAIAEVAKYTVKATDLIDRPKVVEVLEPALKGRRLIAYGDLFKKVKARLKLNDEDLADVQKFEIDKIIDDPLITKLLLTWNFGAKIYKVRVLKEGEFEPGLTQRKVSADDVLPMRDVSGNLKARKNC
jgi:plasmid rolling circle replication initiator protein Rep